MRSVVLLLLVVLFVAACSEKQCEMASDCSSQPCKTANCFDSDCSYTTKQHCCGNGIQESIENGKPGNACTCPQDYGACEGKATIQQNGRTIPAQYVGNYCVSQACVLSIDPKDIIPHRITQTHTERYFTLDVIIDYPNPMILGKDAITFSLTLQNFHNDYEGPLQIKRIQITQDERLYGQQLNTATPVSLGETIRVTVPLEGELPNPEEKIRLSYKLDYEHQRSVRGQRLSDGTYQYIKEPVRDTIIDTIAPNLYLADVD